MCILNWNSRDVFRWTFTNIPKSKLFLVPVSEHTETDMMIIPYSFRQFLITQSKQQQELSIWTVVNAVFPPSASSTVWWLTLAEVCTSPRWNTVFHGGIALSFSVPDLCVGWPYFLIVQHVLLWKADALAVLPHALWVWSLTPSLNTQYQPPPLHVWVCDLQ